MSVGTDRNVLLSATFLAFRFLEVEPPDSPTVLSVSGMEQNWSVHLTSCKERKCSKLETHKANSDTETNSAGGNNEVCLGIRFCLVLKALRLLRMSTVSGTVVTHFLYLFKLETVEPPSRNCSAICTESAQLHRDELHVWQLAIQLSFRNLSKPKCSYAVLSQTYHLLKTVVSLLASQTSPSICLSLSSPLTEPFSHRGSRSYRKVMQYLDCKHDFAD